MALDDLEDAIRRKAEFCLNTGIAPSEYDAMTDLEVDLFTEVHNARANK